MFVHPLQVPATARRNYSLSPMILDEPTSDYNSQRSSITSDNLVKLQSYLNERRSNNRRFISFDALNPNTWSVTLQSLAKRQNLSEFYSILLAKGKILDLHERLISDLSDLFSVDKVRVDFSAIASSKWGIELRNILVNAFNGSDQGGIGQYWLKDQFNISYLGTVASGLYVTFVHKVITKNPINGCVIKINSKSSKVNHTYNLFMNSDEFSKTASGRNFEFRFKKTYLLAKLDILLAWSSALSITFEKLFNIKKCILVIQAKSDITSADIVAANKASSSTILNAATSINLYNRSLELNAHQWLCVLILYYAMQFKDDFLVKYDIEPAMFREYIFNQLFRNLVNENFKDINIEVDEFGQFMSEYEIEFDLEFDFKGLSLNRVSQGACRWTVAQYNRDHSFDTVTCFIVCCTAVNKIVRQYWDIPIKLIALWDSVVFKNIDVSEEIKTNIERTNRDLLNKHGHEVLYGQIKSGQLETIILTLRYFGEFIPLWCIPNIISCFYDRNGRFETKRLFTPVRDFYLIDSDQYCSALKRIYRRPYVAQIVDHGILPYFFDGEVDLEYFKRPDSYFPILTNFELRSNVASCSAIYNIDLDVVLKTERYFF